jgi:hypothetical protein
MDDGRTPISQDRSPRRGRPRCRRAGLALRSVLLQGCRRSMIEWPQPIVRAPGFED